MTKNIVFYSIGVDKPITPQTPLPLLPKIPRGCLAVIEGRAPIWRYGAALHLLHGSPAGAVAFFDPRLGAVVVASHSPDYKEGDVLDIELPESDEEPPSAKNESETSESKITASWTLADRFLEWLRPVCISPARLDFHFAEGCEFEIPRLRGVFGKALKSVSESVYAKVFEGKGNGPRNLPRYLMRPAETSEREKSKLTFESGFWESIDFMTWDVSASERSLLIRAWEVASRFGLGRDRVPFILLGTLPLYGRSDDSPVSLADLITERQPQNTSSPIRLNFPVPLRIIARQEDEEDSRRTRFTSPTYPDLIRSILYRLAALRRQIAGTDSLESLPNFSEEILSVARQTSSSVWRGEEVAMRRYSASQRAEIDLAGTIGSLTLPQGAGELWPLLAAGEIVHLGKSTTLGLGRLQVCADLE